MSYRQSSIRESLTEIYAKQVSRSEFTEDPDPRTFLERLADRAIAEMMKEPPDMEKLLDALEYFRWACGASGRYREKESMILLVERVRNYGLANKDEYLENLRKLRRSVGVPKL